MLATTERWLLEFASECVDAGMSGNSTGQRVEGRTDGVTAPVNGECGSFSFIAFIPPKALPFAITPYPELWKAGMDCLPNKGLPGAGSIMDDS